MKHLFFFMLALCAGIPVFAGGSLSVTEDATVEMLRKDFGVKFTDDNRIVVFKSGQEKFDDLFLAIRAARHTIHLEYFNFRNDSISKALFALLEQKAAEGVKVRALFDGFGNSSNDRPLRDRHIERIRAEGVELYYFDPVVFPWINHAYHRDHRKIVVIDGMIAYTGGMNVADYYIKGKPELGDWRDLHVRVEGSAVGELQKVFLDFWNKVTWQNVQGADLYPGYKDARKYFPMLKRDEDASAGRKKVGVVNRIPHVTTDIIRNTFCSLLDNAQHSVRVVNPYFTLSKKTIRAFKRALARGINVEIMVSEKSDIKITPRIVEYNANLLMKYGAKVFFYQGGFHHSKAMMVDDRLTFIGSANLNSRSMAYDYECNLLIDDSCTTRDLLEIFDRDKITRCFLLTPEYREQMSKWTKAKGWMFNIFRPFVYEPKVQRESRNRPASPLELNL